MKKKLTSEDLSSGSGCGLLLQGSGQAKLNKNELSRLTCTLDIGMSTSLASIDSSHLMDVLACLPCN